MKTHNVAYLAFSLLWLSFIFPVSGQTIPDSKTLTPEPVIDTLANGFTYIIQPIAENIEKNEIRLIVNAGSNQERDDQYEHAHLLEHIAFNYLESYTNFNFDTNILSALQMKQNDMHAITLRTSTYYQFSYPKTNAIALDTLLNFGYEIASGKVVFHKEQIKAEKKAVYQEYLLKEPEKNYSSHKIYNTLFNCNKPVVPPNEFKDKLMNSSDSALQEFYHQWYRPDVMTLLLVGKFDDPDKIEAKIRKIFENIPLVGKKPSSRDCIQNYIANPEKFIVEQSLDSNVSLSRFQFYFSEHYKHTSEWEKLQKEEFWHILSPIIQDRLLKLQHRYTIDYYSNFMPYYDLSQNSLYIHTPPSSIKKNVEDVFAILAGISENGITKTELTTAIQSRKQFISEPHQSPVSFWSDYYMNLVINDKPTKQNLKKRLLFLNQLKLKDLYDYVKTLRWIPNNISVIIPKTENREDYIKEDLLRFIKEGIKNPRAVPKIKTPKNLIPQEEQARLIPAQIIDRQNGDYGEEIITLENGVTLILKQNNPITGRFKDKIMMHGFSPQGSACFGSQDYEAILSPLILKNSGLGNYDKFEINNFLETTSFKHHYRNYITPYETGFEGAFAPEDLENFLQTVYLSFARPTPKPEAFLDWKMQEAKDRVRNSRPGNNFMDFIEEQIGYIGIPRGIKRYKESLTVDYYRALKKYEHLHAHPEKYTVLVVGPYNKEKMLPLLRKYLGNLPSQTSKAFLKCDNYLPHIPENKNSHYKFTEPVKNTYLSIKFSIPDKHIDYKTALNLELLQTALNFKLKQLRFNNHLGVYSARAIKSMQPETGMSSIEIYLQCSTDDFDKVLTSCNEFFRELKSESLDPATIKAIKNGADLKKWKEPARNENSELIQQLYDHYQHQLAIPSEDIMQYDIESFSAKDLKDVAKMYFNEKFKWTFIGSSEN
ncbi:protein containing peptidase M16 domain [Zunongwangia profunda SM-A87]|uniref:Protein containing peptidase M16 domain n=1 Tax=Zunongwangia profunda (strain DSM 18752 / CCTCC AB 206139 / SM-A87) TaxID=655815 RepID=D5BJF4_ZUNPS|nr:insulinase family protein [Zunongwangia profunda]ADF51620.1 protein containing peptidase M16 domain [Zunongwangia profunda SM-A87]